MADNQKSVKAVVDRFESGTAVLQLLDLDVTLQFPIVLLPDAANEGSVLEIDVENRPDLEKKRRKEIEELQHQLIEKPDDEESE